MRFLLGTVFIDILGLGIIVPIAPALVTGLPGGNIHVYALLVVAYGLLQWLTAPILGALSDRYGRRPVLLTSLALLGGDYLLHATAPTVWWLLLSRALAGTFAGTYPVVHAYIADVTPPERRARAFGQLGAAFGLGFMAGPAIGGLLGSVNLRLPFFVAAGLAFANVGYGYLCLPAPRSSGGPVRLMGPLAAFRALTARPELRALAWSRLCSDIGRQIHQVIWVLYATGRFGWGTAPVGAAIAVAALAGAGASGYLVEPARRLLGERRTVVAGQLIWAGTLAATGLTPWGWALWPLIVLGSLGGVASAVTTSWISRRTGAHEQGAVQGAFSGIGSFTEAAVPYPAAAIYAWSAGVGAPGLILVVGALSVTLSSWLASSAAAAPAEVRRSTP